MAGDEKHARELIAGAREDHHSLNNSVSALYPTPLCACGEGNHPCKVTQLTDALEAALPGDDDWEYGNTAENGFMYPMPSLKAAIENCASDTTVRLSDGTVKSYPRHVVRRRPSGPWEPVEEVPRAEG